MNRQEKPRLVLTRLEDRSLEAYKAWIRGMLKGLKGDDYDPQHDRMSEEDWAEAHRKFWADAKQSLRGNEAETPIDRD